MGLTCTGTHAHIILVLVVTKITEPARKGITAHSCTGDVVALRNDLLNEPKHYFADHSNCNSTISSKKSTSPSSSARLESLSPGLFCAIESASYRIISKAAQLVGNHTGNLCENFQSKMHGGKFFNRVQSGSFQHRSMAATLRVQFGPECVSKFWERKIGEAGMYLSKFGQSRKRKLDFDTSWKISEKYKRQHLMKQVYIEKKSIPMDCFMVSSIQ